MTPVVWQTGTPTVELVGNPFDSPIATPIPTVEPTPDDLPVVVSEEPIETGPYQKILWSPDNKKALISKMFESYMLVPDYGQSGSDKLPPGLVPGLRTALGDLWLLDLETWEERKLTTRIGPYTWSPDSRQVAYVKPVGKEGLAGMLVVQEITSGKKQQIVKVDFLGSEYRPQWLPTGEIIFVRAGQLWAVNVPDMKERKLPKFRFRSGAAVNSEQTPADFEEIETLVGYHFSPDGKRVAYKTLHENKRVIAQKLWLANADGSNTQLLTGQAEGSYYNWSPNGDWLVFNTYRDINEPTLDERLPNVRGLWVAKGDGSEIYRVYRTEGWGGIYSPAWSPDNAMLIFVQGEYINDQGEQKSLWIAHATKTDSAKRLSISNPQNDFANVRLVWWAPNGNEILSLTDITNEYIDNYKSTRIKLETLNQATGKE